MISGLAITLSLALALTPPAIGQETQQPVSPYAGEMLNLSLRGVYFVPNEGQWSDGSVYYGFKSRGLDVAFRESSFTMHLRREVGNSTESRIPFVMEEEYHAAHAEPPGEASKSAEFESLTLTVTFPGSNPVQPDGADPRTAKFNYFIGDDESKWASNVASFGAIIYRNLYDGIDLHVCGSDDGVLKYEFHVAPGADYSQIRIAYDGIDGLCIDDAGDLQISSTFGTLRDSAPVAWQETSEKHCALSARFNLSDAHTCSFALGGPLDPQSTIVIDPEIEWARYLGGSGIDLPFGMTIDDDGNCIVVGYTYSSDFEGHQNELSGLYDAFVSKLSPTGDLQWATYCGGNSIDRANAVVSDAAGNLFVTGMTNSYDFPRRTNSHHGAIDVFITELDASGLINASSYFGGISEDWGWDIAVDHAGNAIVSGYTASQDFEGRNNTFHGGTSDAFLLKVAPDLSLQWMIYLGGEREDGGRGSGQLFYVRLAIDGNDNVCVAGDTRSFETFEGHLNESHNYGTSSPDAFAVKVSSSGELQWMLYLGGSGSDNGLDIAADGRNRFVVVGWTLSSDFEGRRNEKPGGGWTAYALRLEPDGVLDGMWYYGPGGYDTSGDAVGVLPTGEIVIAGWTHATNWDRSSNSYHGGYNDGYVMKTDASGNVLSMTYLGGPGDDGSDAIAVSAAGRVYVAGETRSASFEGQLNDFRGGTSDAFVARVSFERPVLWVESACPESGLLTVTWADTTPHRNVCLAFAHVEGQITIPNGQPCEGTILGLGRDHRQIVFVGPAGTNGSRALNTNAGPGICGGYLQLVDGATCRTSNIVQIQ